ncbi:putative ribonuclease H protein, partial [Mucuna pruriens]
MEKHWKSLSFQERFDREVLFHCTYLSHALKDYFSLLMWLWRIKVGILFNFLEGPFNSCTKPLLMICYCLQKQKLVRWSLLELYFNYFAKVPNKRFQRNDDLGKYLKSLYYIKEPTKIPISFIMDKVNQRLSVWKAKQLSFAGRVTLTKLVLQALPTKMMQSTMLYKSINIIDKKCKNFIWGDTNQSRKIHMTS